MSDDPRIDAAEAIDATLGAARANGAGQSKEQSTPLRIVDPRVFEGKPVPDRRWIVHGWIPCGCATALYGPGGFGKSLLALQLMTAAALGKPWLGVPITPVRSLGIFCEDDEDELQRRQAAINYQLYGCGFADLGDMRWMPRLGENNLIMVPSRKTGQMTPTGFFEQICAAARDFEAELIVIDTVADTFGGNQNDAGQVRQYVQYGLGRLARAIGGGAVLACPHPSRAGIYAGSGESGSVQWDAAFRSRLYLSAPKEDDDDPTDLNARVLTRKKANYAVRDETIDLCWHDGVLGAVGESSDERPDAATVFLDILDKMTAERQALSHKSRSGNYAPKLFTTRPERRGYGQRDFERAMQALLKMRTIGLEEYGSPSDLRQKIVRCTAPF